MVENQRNLCLVPYLDKAIFQPFKIKLVLFFVELWFFASNFLFPLFLPHPHLNLTRMGFLMGFQTIFLPLNCRYGR